MKIAVIQLSDFHVSSNLHFESMKIEKLSSAIKSLGQIEHYAIVFTGDLANEASINEYRCGKSLLNRIILEIKKINNKYVPAYLVPGNHDVVLNECSRTGAEINNWYRSNCIEEHIKDELDLMRNYFKLSPNQECFKYDRLFDKQIFDFSGYRIQFNLINSALFSTLKPDDKELHYFPIDNIFQLRKTEGIYISITASHHNFEFFNWKYKNTLEKEVVNNSEVILFGHDHYNKTNQTSYNSDDLSIILHAGEMKFHDLTFEDSFNVLVIDTEKSVYDALYFKWDNHNCVYVHHEYICNNSFTRKSNTLRPLSSFTAQLINECSTNGLDINKIFTFPTLLNESRNESNKSNEISTLYELLNVVKEKKKIQIIGENSSGKSTLLKQLYTQMCNEYVPLFISVDSTTKIHPKKFILEYFTEQFGNEYGLFDKYKQLEKSRRVLFLDGVDQLKQTKSKDSFLSEINAFFDIVILSSGLSSKDVVDNIKESIGDPESYIEYQIRPFFKEKRNELINKVCLASSLFDESEIDRVNNIIDKLVLNNSALFSLTPGYIIKYACFFIKERNFDYSKCEAIFSTIFEHGIKDSIIKLAKDRDVDPYLTALEKIAGYMFENKVDLLSTDKIIEIVQKYKNEYGKKIVIKDFLPILLEAGIFKVTDDLSYYFSNKNYLAYFAAKHLLFLHSDEEDSSGIIYALENICFGINSDIIMFVLYLSNNTKTVMDLVKAAAELLSPWYSLDLEDVNILLLKGTRSYELHEITQADREKYNKNKEHVEEVGYSSVIVEARGSFDYDIQTKDDSINRIHRAMIYTDMLCKGVSVFDNRLKLDKRKSIVKAIYSYVSKICYALFQPIDSNLDLIIDELMVFSKEKSIKKDGEDYTREDFMELVREFILFGILAVYERFAMVCSDSKSIDLFKKHYCESLSDQIFKLVVIENSGNTQLMIEATDKILDSYKSNALANQFAGRVFRKYMLENPKLDYKQRQFIADHFYGTNRENQRKKMLISSIKNK